MAALQTSGLYHRVDLFATYPYCIYPKTVEISHGRKRVAYRLTVVSTNLEYRESQKKRKREKEKVGDRPAKLNEKKSDRELEREREIKNKGYIFY